jgi:hypothetical protein
MAKEKLGDWHYRAVIPEANLYTVSVYEGHLSVRCCRKCSKCAGTDLELWLPLTPQAVEAFRD